MDENIKLHVYSVDNDLDICDVFAGALLIF